MPLGGRSREHPPPLGLPLEDLSVRCIVVDNQESTAREARHVATEEHVGLARGGLGADRERERGAGAGCALLKFTSSGEVLVTLGTRKVAGGGSRALVRRAGYGDRDPGRPHGSSFQVIQPGRRIDDEALRGDGPRTRDKQTAVRDDGGGQCRVKMVEVSRPGDDRRSKQRRQGHAPGDSLEALSLESLVSHRHLVNAPSRERFAVPDSQPDWPAGS